MLVLAIKPQEMIRLELPNGELIELKVTQSSPGKARIVFRLPESVSVSRVKELARGRTEWSPTTA